MKKQQVYIDNNKKEKREEILYRQFLEGDTDSFEQLVLMFRQPLTLFLMSILKSYEISEDIAQDVFVEIFVNKDRYRLGSGLKTYLYTIGRNKAVDYIRKHSKSMATEDLTQLDSNQLVVEDQLLNMIELEEKKILLYQCLKEIKEEYKLAILLIDFEELSYKDAAVILKKTIPQIKVLVHRARKSLKVQLEKEGYKHEVR